MTPRKQAGSASADKSAEAKAAKSAETKQKLIDGALKTLIEQGIAKASARTIAAAAGVNQALVFYHFGSVDELLAAACRQGSQERVALYRDRLDKISTLSELLAFGREMHEQERATGHVAVLAQLLAGAQTHQPLAPATAAGLDLWIAEIEKVLVRVLSASPLGEFADPVGLARAVSASFVGIELYEGVDPAGAERALAAIEQLSVLATAVEDLGPLAQRAVRHRLRRSTRSV
ncbi:TetR/AcrR family transcriptional regulator [Streptomyces sp. TRM66268-LWL]|uniref:TetR/AcrR family transcriptional regulator n=1 Tax=Streptomyces polyasparticus TaxID=2767826 RepID=A0ABR7S7E5_9ACTN|nr:TetR/AcrR family transcriptional regulator [Streptomyces polyasparticus]MBC9711391.1 TetR/AcrR family transcriptional regulator [Streptomyces polyasparticus]